MARNNGHIVLIKVFVEKMILKLFRAWLKKCYWSYLESGWKNFVEVILSLAEKIVLKLFRVWLKNCYWSYFESDWKNVIEVISSLAEKMLLKYFECEGSRTFSAKFWVLKATLRNLVSLRSINPFLVNFPILFPPENSKKLVVFWCFQGV